MVVFIPLGLDGLENWNSVVSIVTRLQAGRLEVQFLARARDSALFKKLRWLWGPPSLRALQWVPGVLSLGVKQLDCEADHSPPCCAEVKNEWSSTSTHL
jgi:hypothetical protein